MDKYILGIDVSKDKLSIYNNKNNSYEEINNNIKSLDKYLIKNKNNLSHQTHKVGLESTGDYHFLAMKYFFKKKYTTILINPLLTKKYNKYSVRNKKTDRSDSELIIDIIKAKEGNEITSEAFNINKRTALRTEQNLIAISSSLKRLRHTLETKSNNGIETEYLQEIVDNLIHNLKDNSKRIMNKVNDKENITRQEKIISSIPGCGIKTTFIISTEFSNILRFNSSKQMVAFAGLDSSVYQSGNKEIRGRISKRGSGMLRKALYQSAFTSLRADNEMKRYYEKKKKEGKHHKIILQALSRKLINRIFALIKEDREFVKRD